MPRKKQCTVCRRRFVPNPHVGDRQKTCGSAACQRERHRRADRAWHAANPGYDRDRPRKAKKGGEAASPPAAAAAAEPSRVSAGRVLAQDAVTPQLLGIIEKIVQIRVRRAQDEWNAQLSKITHEFRGKPALGYQEASASGGPAP